MAIKRKYIRSVREIKSKTSIFIDFAATDNYIFRRNDIKSDIKS